MIPAPRSLLPLVLAACVAAAAAAPARANPSAVAAGDVVLLDFSAPWCGPCRQMAPLIGEITAAGWVVRHIDVDHEGDLVRRFAVTGVPCYVLLVKGQEVGRINGATTRGELENLLAKSRQPLGLPAAPAAATAAQLSGVPLPVAPAAAPLATDVPARPQARIPAAITAVPPAQPPRDRAPPRAAAAEPPAARAAAGQFDPAARVVLERRLMSATARLLVSDGKGVSRGTGTVVDCRQGEALILTCGHIFRDSQGKGRVEVDLFGPDGPQGVAGQVVAWDLKRDVALVSIFTDKQIEPVRVGGNDRKTTPGEPVLTVGCNGGDDPTIHYSRVTAVDKYLGPANVQVAGQPVQGRSGGGLFAADGTLIGVCNAADPAENEGLFAALPTIHDQLDEAGLAFVYRSVYPSGGADLAAAGPLLPNMPAEMPPVSFDRRDRADSLPTAATVPNAAAMTPAAVTVPSAAAESRPARPLPLPPAPRSAAQPLSPGEQALVDHVWRNDDEAEVICIVRPRGGQPAASEVFVLQGTGRELAEQLSKARGGTATARADMATLPAAAPLR